MTSVASTGQAQARARLARGQEQSPGTEPADHRPGVGAGGVRRPGWASGGCLTWPRVISAGLGAGRLRDHTAHPAPNHHSLWEPLCPLGRPGADVVPRLPPMGSRGRPSPKCWSCFFRAVCPRISGRGGGPPGSADPLWGGGGWRGAASSWGPGSHTTKLCYPNECPPPPTAGTASDPGRDPESRWTLTPRRSYSSRPA